MYTVTERLQGIEAVYVILGNNMTWLNANMLDVFIRWLLNKN